MDDSKEKFFYKKNDNILDRSVGEYPMRGIDDLHRRL
jgi:hypothetical protein